MKDHFARSGEWRVAGGEWRVASGERRVASECKYTHAIRFLQLATSHSPHRANFQDPPVHSPPRSAGFTPFLCAPKPNGRGLNSPTIATSLFSGIFSSRPAAQ